MECKKTTIDVICGGASTSYEQVTDRNGERKGNGDERRCISIKSIFSPTFLHPSPECLNSIKHFVIC